MSEYKKYLPSRKFIIVILTLIILIVLFFSIRLIVHYFKNKKIETNAPTPVTIGTLIQKDSNSNGITDVEEYLWGLDPKKNGEENKAFITAKKKTLERSGIISTSDESKLITDNEMLSQQFFAALIALQQTGELNEESLRTMSESLGKNIEPTPIPDIYTKSMMTIQEDSLATKTSYVNNFSNLVDKYKDSDIGSELTFIIQGLSDKDPQALYAAKTVGMAYQSFGSDLIQIPVPVSFSSLHLSIANNYEKTGQAVNNLSKILSDPLLGMKSIISYKQYSDKLASDLEKIYGLLQ